jgi:hypothetical protein
LPQDFDLEILDIDVATSVRLVIGQFLYFGSPKDHLVREIHLAPHLALQIPKQILGLQVLALDPR